MGADRDVELLVDRRSRGRLSTEVLPPALPGLQGLVSVLPRKVSVPPADEVGVDLTQQAREGKLRPVVGRDKEIRRVASILLRETKNTPLLVGKAGVGKTAIVHGLAQWLGSGRNVGGSLRNARIVEVSVASLVAGTMYRGDFEARMEELVGAARSGDTILFFDELHTIVGAGAAGRGALDAGNILKPFLARGEIRCIGATTDDEYRRLIEPDHALARRFQIVPVEEPSPEAATEVLRGLRATLERHFGMQISDEAIAAAVRLAVRYVPDRCLPDKACDLLEEACAVAAMEAGESEEPACIGEQEVARVLEGMAPGLRVGQVTENEQTRLRGLEEALQQRVVGQEAATAAVSQAVRRARAHGAVAERPAAVLALIGPTGVGKTSLAKALGAELFGPTGAVVWLDMSEYSSADTRNRLVGAPPGYIGHETEGQLTGPLRRRPHCLVILEDVERAHPEVQDLLLQLLETAEAIRQEHGCANIADPELTLALLRVADEELQSLLAVWATEERVEQLRATATRRSKSRGASTEADTGPKPFLDDGSLSPEAFSASGGRICQRLREDAASMSAKKLTSRHILYTLLASDTGLLPAGLAMLGFDVKRDLHSLLSRELIRPGKKRNDSFELKRENLFGSVVALFTEAATLAAERGSSVIGELDLCRAFLSKQPQELRRLIPPETDLDATALGRYLEEAEAEADEEPEAPLRRFTIREIEDRINNTIFGQQQAVNRLMPWIKRMRFGIPRDGRPAGVFLLLGPTGTGKTQMAKELARYVFGAEDAIIFLEMGQFQIKEAMNTFVGAPPGYVGYGEGKLTNGLRDKAESVVLFDEIEKANTEVFDCLMRFADEGIISDPAGPVRDGTRCILVLTTNAGQTWLREHLKSNPNAREAPDTLAEALYDAAMKELREKGFRPEFLGRTDERISFLPFSVAVCRQIIDKVLGSEIDKFRTLKGVEVEVKDAARQRLAEMTFERATDEGARGAPRAVNERIVSPVIDLLSDYAESGRPLPTRLIADVRGLGDRIVVEPEG